MASWQPGHDRPLLPWSSETVPQQGRHVHILDEPEQLRGPLSPHRKDGIQDGEAGASHSSELARVPVSARRYLCALDIPRQLLTPFSTPFSP